MLGRYGKAVDPTKAPDINGNLTYIDRADFNFGYQSMSSASGSGGGHYTVSSGDTLQGIAQSVYGDASLRYVIADANGLSSDADMQVGQSLTIPNKTAGLHNNSGTYQPYDAGAVKGSTAPTLHVQPPPPPGQNGGCGTLGTILVIGIIGDRPPLNQSLHIFNHHFLQADLSFQVGLDNQAVALLV